MSTRHIKKSFLVVNPPAAEMKVPAPPQGFVVTNAKDYAGTKPNKSELASLTDAVAEFAGFTDYLGVFGRIAPPQEHVMQTLGAASQWSSLRVALTALEPYLRTQEGLAWVDTRKLIAKLKPAYNLAVASDPMLLTKYPSMGRLFEARSRSARRAAVTRGETKAKSARAAAGAVTPAAPPAPAPAVSATPPPAAAAVVAASPAPAGGATLAIVPALAVPPHAA